MQTSSFENVLKENFDWPSFREGQKGIISSILEKKDVLAVLPTGGGKSLCYQFPAVYLKQLVIVVSPLIALMKDQVSALERRGIPAACLYSGQSDAEKREVFQRIHQGGTFLLYLSPERVQKEGFKRWIQGRQIGLFAIDEAHCVSQWGHDFREEYGQLSTLKELRQDVPVLALTASATPLVLNDISKNLRLIKPERHVHGFYRPNLYFQVQLCPDDGEKMIYLNQAISQTQEGRILIYCGTRKSAEELANELAKRFDRVGFYHAGLSGGERNEIQEKYISGETRILVATNAFGMGIDQPDVRVVVHFHLPANIDSLYQEMGRAGRDGKPSTCLLLYSRKDKGLQAYFITQSEVKWEIRNSKWKNLEALIAYAEGSECRHAEVLTYFKDSMRLKKCGHCDNCAPEAEHRVKKPKVEDAPRAEKAILRKKKTSKEISLSEIEDIRFQALRIWRKKKADELDAPAFIIFSDQTLKEIAIGNPGSLEDLNQINGIGPTKLEKFGREILLVLK